MRKWQYDQEIIPNIASFMYKAVLALLIYTISCGKLCAQPYHFRYNSNCTLAYQKASALQLTAATDLIIREMRADPNNLVPVLLANYVDFYQLFFNEDPKMYAKAESNLDLRVRMISEASDTCTMKQYALGVLYFQRALIYAKFNHQILAVRKLSASREAFALCKRKFPSYHDGDMYLGTINALLGTVPDGYKWLARLLGFSGDVNQGTAQQLAALKYKSSTNEFDQLLLFTYTKQYVQNKPQEAWQFLKPYMPKAENNRLLTFLIANIALNQNNSSTALHVIDKNIFKQGFMDFPFLLYEKASAQLYGLDRNCEATYLAFVKQYKGTFYVKDAYYKLALHSYLTNDAAAMHRYRKAIAGVGKTEAEADKIAQEFGQTSAWPNKVLLEARFLCDGGYYSKAQAKLAGVQVAAFVADDLSEYYYRLARIADLSGDYSKALAQYDKCFQQGKSSRAYFAARACLQIAMIYEAQSKTASALQWYKQCLALGDHQYKNSIDQKAKAGVARLQR
jgi:hypothetical protein